jgi:exosortase E/protease (VPEID-CTERM system)
MDSAIGALTSGRRVSPKLRFMSAIEPAGTGALARRTLRPSLAARMGLLAVALVAEKSALNLLVDFHRADAVQGLGTVLRIVQHFGLRFAASFAVALAFFIYVRRDEPLLRVNAEARDAAMRPGWLALHGVSMVAVAAALYNLYGEHGVHLPLALLGSAVLLLSAAGAFALVLALAPWPLWRRAAAAVGLRWAYAALAAALGTGAIIWSQELWAPTAQLTFGLVRDVLSPILPALQADAATRILRTPRFAVEVSSICSGLEGIGLMFAFCSAWLLYFRAEYRFPRALLIIPAGILFVFALNVLRIAALVLIGNAGYPNVAVYGFHSQAGWIGFNCAACGVAFASRRSRWLNRTARHEDGVPTENPTATYLLPFLAVLAAGMISRASSSGFETWYALRLIAAATVLAVAWRPLSRLDWRFGWRGIAVGSFVFALWLGAAHFLLARKEIPPPLAAMGTTARDLWIAIRILTSVLVLPLAGELAYRGYLMRRLLAEDFESVSFASIGWMPLLVTAAAFGVLHGTLWLPGIAAGAAYGLVLIRTGRMGEAVAAHATSNLLIAASVLAAGQWQLWQ